MHRGFTLIELAVVLVIVGIVAGLTLPPMLTSDRRKAESVSRAVAALLTAAAQRDALGGERRLIEHDPESGILRLRVHRSIGAGRDAEAAWRDDPFVPRVRLDPCVIRSARVGTARFAAEPFVIALAPGTPRPDIEMTLAGPAGRTWTASLPAWRATTSLAGPGSDPPPLARPIDLDAAGRSDMTW